MQHGVKRQTVLCFSVSFVFSFVFLSLIQSCQTQIASAGASHDPWSWARSQNKTRGLMLHTSHVFSPIQSQLALCTISIHYSHRLQLVLATCMCMLVVGLPVPIGSADGLEWSWLTETDTSIVVPFVAVVVVVAFVAVDAGCWSLHVFYASWFRNLPPHLNLHFLIYFITFVIRFFFRTKWTP